MLKKTFLSSMIFLSTSTAIFAKSISYVGGGLGLGGYNQFSKIYGANASLFAGKGMLFGESQKFYLGGEVNGNVGLHPGSLGVGARIIPGIMVTESTMLYTSAGLASDYNFKHKNISNEKITFTTQVGVGVQTNVAKNWAVRAEYISFGYRKPNHMGVGLVYKFD